MADITNLKKHLQLLRNGEVKASKLDAINAVKSALAQSAKVGEPALGIYSVGEDSNKKNYAVLGINVDGNIQIIEGVEATQKAIDAALASAKTYTDTSIQALDVTDNAVEGSYVSAVSEADGKISVARAELPTVAEVKSEGQAIVSVKEDKGVITATVGDIAAAHVTIADGHFTSDTVEGALSELFTKTSDGSKVTLESADGEGDVLKVYTIKQGGNSVGTINIPKDLVVKSGSVVNGNWVDGVFTENASGSGTALKLVIANQTAPVYINTLDLVKDHTAGNGIAISDTNVVSVVVDGASEDFLTVGAEGVKLSGVADHVASEIGKLSANTSGESAHVKVNVVENSGVVTSVKVEENDIASAALLGTTSDTSAVTTAFGFIAKEVANREAAIAALDTAVTSTGGTHVTVKVDEADGLITAVTVSETNIASESALNAEIAARKAVDGQSGQTYEANTTAIHISGATSLNDADVKLNNAISANTQAIADEASARTAADDALGTRLTKAEAMLGIVTGATGEVETVETKIAKAISGLDATVVSETADTKLVVTVVETDGKLTSVSVNDKDIASKALLGASSDASSAETAFGKIQKNAEAITAEKSRAEAAEKKNADAIATLNGADTVAGSVANKIKTAIEALDVDAVGGDGKVIATVSEKDGKISATTIDLTAGNVKATASIGDDTHVAVEGDDVAAQIASLAKSIKTTVADAKSYSIAAVEGDELTALGTNVKEAFKLVDEDGAKAGEFIKIYKDSSLKEVALSGQTLKFTYILADASEDTVDVDVSTFLAESEFKDGLEVVDHVVKVKKDASSEGFLTVGAEGVKLSGVQTAIDNAAAKATTKVVKDASANKITLTSSVSETDSSVTYTIGQNDIASEAALNDEVNRAKAAEDKIEASVGLAEDGSHIATSGHYTSGASTIAGEIAALDTQVSVNASAITKEVADRTKDVKDINDLLGTSVDDSDKKTAFGRIKANAEAIETLNGNSGTTGSVAKAVADLKATLISGATAQTFKELEDAIDTVKNAAISVAAGDGIKITETGTTKTISVVAFDKSIGVSENGVKVNLVSGGPIVLDEENNGLTLGVWDLGNY